MPTINPVQPTGKQQLYEHESNHAQRASENQQAHCESTQGAQKTKMNFMAEGLWEKCERSPNSDFGDQFKEDME